MRKFFLLFTFFFISFQIANAQSWKIIWKEEFNYDGAPKPHFWNYDENLYRNHFDIRVGGGHLFLRSAQDANGNFLPAELHTKNKVDFKNGRIEIKAKLPKHQKLLPLLGLMGTNIDEVGYPLCGEINIKRTPEAARNNYKSFIKTQGDEPDDNKNLEKDMTVDKSDVFFHIYAFEWDQSEISLFVDDQLHYKHQRSESTEWPFANPLYLVLALGLDDDMEEINHSYEITSQYMVIDYVRYFRKNVSNQTHAASAKY